MITNELYDLIHAGSYPESVAWLEQKPDDLNSWISDGYAPLHIACMFGHETIAKFLVDRGALVNMNAMNASRTTPLHLAVCFREEATADRLARFLVDHGAELNAPQEGGQTPLHHAVARGSALLVRTLVEAGADPFLKDAQDRSPADLAKTLSGDAADEAESIREELKRAFALN